MKILLNNIETIAQLRRKIKAFTELFGECEMYALIPYRGAAEIFQYGSGGIVQYRWQDGSEKSSHIRDIAVIELRSVQT